MRQIRVSAVEAASSVHHLWLSVPKWCTGYRKTEGERVRQKKREKWTREVDRDTYTERQGDRYSQKEEVLEKNDRNA